MRPQTGRTLRRAPTLLAVSLAFAGGLLHAAPSAAGAWRQSEFVIGTWIDANVVPGDPDYSARTLALARGAYVNLFTGTHSRAGGATYPIDTPSLDLIGAAGLHTALSHPIYYGMGGMDPVSVVGGFDPAKATSFLSALTAPAIDASADSTMSGYCLWDEVPDGALQGAVSGFVKSWTSAIHAEQTLHRAALPPRFAWVNFFHLCQPDTCYRSYLDAYLNDADTLRRPDVASVGLWPFTGPAPAIARSPYFTWMRILGEAQGSRPFWVISMLSEAQADAGFARPDDAQIRAMAFCPVAAGAKGVIWYGYGNRHVDDGDACFGMSCPEAAVVDGSLATDKWRLIAPVDHYLHDVVGPLVMNSDYLGVFHASQESGYGDPRASLRLLGDPLCPVLRVISPAVDTCTAVGVFRPRDGSGDLVILVVNKLLTPITRTLVLRQQSYVSASPSVIGFVGGAEYAPVSPVALGSVTVALAGGEGRFYRLSAHARTGLVLDQPRGGESWVPGTRQTVRWHGASGPVTVALQSDVDETASGAAGPIVVRHLGRTGGADSLTVPAVYSRRAHVVISCVDAAGLEHRVTHNAPLRIVGPGIAAGEPSWLLARTNGTLLADLAVDAASRPHVVLRDSLGRLVHEAFDGTQWSRETLPDIAAPEVPVGGWLDTFGEPTLTLDHGDRPHVVAKGLYFGMRCAFVRAANGAWSSQLIAPADSYLRDAAAAIAPDDSIFHAGQPGIVGGRALKLVACNGSPNAPWTSWADYQPAIPSAFAPAMINVVSDAAGEPCVAFVDGVAGGTQTLHVRRHSTAGWREMAQGGHFGAVSLALDAVGEPSVAFTTPRSAGGNALFLLSSAGGTWTRREQVVALPADVRAISLAWAQGIPRVAFVANGVLQYATRAATAWTVSVLDSLADAAGPVKLAFGPDGRRWILFHDRTAKAARVLGPGAAAASVPGGPADAAAPRFAASLAMANPLHAGASLVFRAHAGAARAFEVTLYDVAGRALERRAFGALEPGEHTLAWTPAERTPGVYFVRWGFTGLAPAARRVVILR